jgi:hypothetical protein
MSRNLKLAFVIDAVDRATEPLRRVGRAIDQVAEPAKRASRFLGGMRESIASRVATERLQRLSGAFSEVTGKGSKLIGTVQGIAQGLGVASVAIGGMFWGLKRAADEIDRTSDTAKKLGLTIEQFQRMGFAAQQTGASQEAMGEGLRFLSQNMVEAVNGSAAATEWFQRVGLSVKQLKGMNAGQVFEAIADKFASIPDAGMNAEKKIAAARALMGRGGDELIQTLNSGSAGMREQYREADRLGVVSTATADRVGTFNDQFDKMVFAIKGVVAAVLNAALPSLQRLVGMMTELSADNRAGWGDRLGQSISRVVDALPGFLKSLALVASAMLAVLGVADRIASALGGWDVVIYAVTALIAGKLLVGVVSLGVALWGLAAPLMAVLIPLAAFIGFWGFVGIAAVAAGALILANWSEVMDWLGGKLKWLMDFATRVMNVVGSVLGSDTVGAAGGQQSELGYMGTVPSAISPGGRDSTVGGVIRLQVDAEGRARVASAKSDNRAVDFEVYSGSIMAAP